MWAPLGTSAYTEFIQANGSSQMIVTDDPWRPDEQFNPKFQVYPASSPLVTRRRHLPRAL
jgi:hypothetical protein